MNKEENIPDFEERFPNGNPFSVPENYFDQFALRMSEKIVDEKPKARNPIRFLLKPATVITLSSLLIITGVLTVYTINQNKNELSSEEISYYVLNEGIDDLELEEIIDYSQIIQSDTSNRKEKTKNSENDEKDEKDDILKYLLEEDVDLNDIINTL
jgi:hypothetical protein